MGMARACRCGGRLAGVVVVSTLLAFADAGRGCAWGQRNGKLAPDEPCVDEVKPTSGSLLGGQLLTIHGANLIPDERAHADPHDPPVQVLVGGQPCEIEPIFSTESKLVCRTPPFLAGGAAERLSAAVLPHHRPHGHKA